MDTIFPTDAPSQVAERLRLAVTRTARRMRQEVTDAASGDVLTPTTAAVLATIERHGPLTPSQIAEREGVKRPTITQALQGLQEAGLVELTPDPADGRSHLVSATAPARKRLAAMRRRKSAYIARRLAELDPDEVETLAAAVTVLEKMLDAERDRQ